MTNGTKVAQDKKLDRSGLDKLLDPIFISEVVGAEKPSREFFAPVFAAFPGIKPEEMLIVGDSLTSDIRGGINAGVQTCWYNPAGVEKTTDDHVDYEITDLHQIYGLL